MADLTEREHPPMPQRDQSNYVVMWPCGDQMACGAEITVEDGRATIRIIGSDTIKLTKIQTEELGPWLVERAPRPERDQSGIGDALTPAKYREDRLDPWFCAGFRVVPAVNVKKAWVVVECPDREVSLSVDEALKLAEHLLRVGRTAKAWRS